VPLAGHGLRPTALRRRAGGPQLKRDPLGSGRQRRMTPRIIVLAILLLTPLTLGGYLQLRLNRHARVPAKPVGPYGFRGFRAEYYGSDGEVWLRRLRWWAALLLPYWILVFLIMRVWRNAAA